jgi:hypothetical protein
LRLEHLYRLRFSYTEDWGVGSQRFGVATGTCEGRLSGRFTGARVARVGEDGLYHPRVDGFIETDGGMVVVEYRGRGRIHPGDEFRAVVAASHASDHEDWKRLNDVVCFGEATNDGDAVVADVYEQVWEAIAE